MPTGGLHLKSRLQSSFAIYGAKTRSTPWRFRSRKKSSVASSLHNPIEEKLTNLPVNCRKVTSISTTTSPFENYHVCAVRCRRACGYQTDPAVAAMWRKTMKQNLSICFLVISRAVKQDRRVFIGKE